MSQESVSSIPSGPAVPLHDVLLRNRQDTRQRSEGPSAYLDPANMGRLACFVLGYLEGLHALGVDEGSDALFEEWLPMSATSGPRRGGTRATWRSSPATTSGPCASTWTGWSSSARCPPSPSLEFRGTARERIRPAGRLGCPPTRPLPLTVDFLRTVRREVGDVPGRLSLFIGPIEVNRMAGLVEGYRLSLALAGLQDEEFARFERWLHEEKGLAPGQGWEAT